MGNMAGGTTTVLASTLYRTLLWQLALLLVIALLVGWWLSRRTPSDSGAAEAEPRGRQVLRISLGVLWIIDGLLQAQPAMPSSFIRVMVAPGLADAPGWLYNIVNPFARLWTQHPVAADAVTVWIQVGLGVAILVARTGLIARVVLWVSIVWALFVWVIGEFVGGMAHSGASLLNGAPGAALLYVLAAVLLLAPVQLWVSGKAARWLRISVGAMFLLGAVLQAIPSAGYWSATGLFNLFSGIASGGMPSWVASPVQSLAIWVPPHASVVNAAIIVVLVVVGVGLIAGVFPRAIVSAALVVSFLMWWFGQGFGVFGGTGTDPNTAAVLLVLLAAAWPYGPVPAPVTTPDGAPSDAPVARRGIGPSVGIAAGVVALFVLPLMTSVAFLTPQSAQAALGDSGGLISTQPSAVSNFTLTDHTGKPISLRSFNGKLVLVAFLDPECYDSCPLIANELASAVDMLGARGAGVEILAVDVNPNFNRVQDVATFTKEHGLAAMPNWHYATGSAAQVGAVLAQFGEGITVPRVGMIGHPQNVYLLGRHGQELAVLNDTANEDLTQSYVKLLTRGLEQRL